MFTTAVQERNQGGGQWEQFPPPNP